MIVRKQKRDRKETEEECGREREDTVTLYESIEL
jgi:hypothetical protein